MSSSRLFGMDKEIHQRLAAKYSVEREIAAREWIELIVGEPFSDPNFQVSLKDGVILCKLMNKLLPGEGKYRISRIPFMQMENIATFLSGADKLGVPKHDLFQTVDLYEGKNIGQVIDTIFALSRFAAKAGIDVPILGPKLADKHEVQFSPEVLNASKGMFNPYQYGYNGGANQSGIVFGGRREIGGVPKRSMSTTLSPVN